eukprot:6213485-Pleurochrysis_carterae.AAC.3
MMRVVTVMRPQPELAQWLNEAFGMPIRSRRRLYHGLGSNLSSRRYRDALDSLVRACELERARSLLARATESPLRPTPFGDASTNSMSAARPDSSLLSAARPDSSLPSAARPGSSPQIAARPDLPQSAARPDSTASAARPD